MEQINSKTPQLELQSIVEQLSPDKSELLLGFARYLDKQDKVNHDNTNLLELLPKALELQNTKEAQYGRSWCKHEDISAFFNLERKWDRIYNIMTRAMKQGTDSVVSGDSSTPTETFVDTLIDLGLYSFMWIGLIREQRPEQYEKFISNNQL